MFEKKEPTKWRIPVLILIGVLVLSSGIYLGIKTRNIDSNKNQAKIEETSNEKSKEVFELNKDCEMWVQKKNEDGSDSKEGPIMIGTIPQELINKSKDEIVAYLKDKYPDRTIENMSKYEIVLSEVMSTNDESKANKYTIESNEGNIGLYKYDAKGNKKLLEKTSISIESLPKTAQSEIKKGVVVDTEDDAYSRLEDFGS